MELTCKSIRDAWPQVVAKVVTGGSDQPVYVDGIYTETRELRQPIMVHIDQPITDMVAKGCGWSEPALEKYANDIIEGRNNGFDYAYGERLRSYGSWTEDRQDQLECLKCLFEEDHTSRQGVMCTWYSPYDLDTSSHKPCLCLLDVKIRGEHVNLTAYFRSHDAFKAWPVNAYGLARLQQYIAGDRWGIGSLTIISNALHIYKVDMVDAIRIAGGVS